MGALTKEQATALRNRCVYLEQEVERLTIERDGWRELAESVAKAARRSPPASGWLSDEIRSAVAAETPEMRQRVADNPSGFIRPTDSSPSPSTVGAVVAPAHNPSAGDGAGDSKLPTSPTKAGS